MKKLKTHNKCSIRANKEKGSSLLEVLISLVVLGVGMLGVLGMQDDALKFNKQAFSYSQAMFLANDMMERIRANKSVAYDTGNAATQADGASGKSCDVASCNAQELRAWDIQQWEQSLAERLPQGKGIIDFQESEGTYTIVIQFQIADSDGSSGGDVRRQRKNEFYYLISGV